MFGHHPKKKKKKLTKKEAQLAKNKRLLMQMNLSALSRGEVADEGLGAPEIVRAPEKERETGLTKKETKSQQNWSSKLQVIRNKNDNSKRVALDRFNRFAGTSDAGGRGR